MSVLGWLLLYRLYGGPAGPRHLLNNRDIITAVLARTIVLWTLSADWIYIYLQYG
jgi:hypothetical protein